MSGRHRAPDPTKGRGRHRSSGAKTSGQSRPLVSSSGVPVYVTMAAGAVVAGLITTTAPSTTAETLRTDLVPPQAPQGQSELSPQVSPQSTNSVDDDRHRLSDGEPSDKAPRRTYGAFAPADSADSAGDDSTAEDKKALATRGAIRKVGAIFAQNPNLRQKPSGDHRAETEPRDSGRIVASERSRSESEVLNSNPVPSFPSPEASLSAPEPFSGGFAPAPEQEADPEPPEQQEQDANATPEPDVTPAPPIVVDPVPDGDPPMHEEQPSTEPDVSPLPEPTDPAGESGQRDAEVEPEELRMDFLLSPSPSSQ